MNATLKPDVLRWVRSKAGLSEDALAERIGVLAAIVKKWELTGSIPFTLVEKLAEKTRTPFGYLFLQEPPQPNLPIADFRRVDDAHSSKPSNDLLEVIYSAQLKQNWYREYLISNGKGPLPFVGKSSTNTPAKETAEDIRKTLNIGSGLAQQTTTSEDTIRCTTEAAEEHGILVLRSGYAGEDTGRKLLVDEFRGFAISDEYAPLIFINGADAPAAQIFTIAHEFAHVWIGETGVSNLEKTYSAGGKIEEYCNSVAAEVVLPLEELHASWRGGINDISEIERLSHQFKVSRIVVARRARDAAMLTEGEFNSYYRLIASPTNKAPGGNYYINEQYKHSRRFSVAIIQEALAGRTMQRDAMQLLGIKKESTFNKYAKALKGGMEWPIY
ncbi:MAG TPA: XRE family transcriptional regulator [Candidatus Saccharimonadales bacterium]|nr:XRE family transcriptional regulator [Candidatus Saccharimonadales bacterium]